MVRSTPEQALVGNIVLCSWARHLTLTVPLSTQVYKWVPANCWGNLTNFGRVTCDRPASRPGEAMSRHAVLAPRLHFIPVSLLRDTFQYSSESTMHCTLISIAKKNRSPELERKLLNNKCTSPANNNQCR